MGTYDTFGIGRIQLKANGLEFMNHYNIGDTVNIDDGIYLAREGIVVIQNSKLVATFNNERNYMFSKWGDSLDEEFKSLSNFVLEFYDPLVPRQNIRLKVEIDP